MLLKAIIFDFDGVITDTEPVHMQAWLHVLSTLNISFGNEEYEANYLGLNDRDFLDAVGRIHNRTFCAEEKKSLINKKLKYTIKSLEESIPVLPGVVSFIKENSRKSALAICSGAIKEEVHFVLKKLKLTDFFDPVITQEDVLYGKPNPEGYKLAFTQLQNRLGQILSTNNCIAIEDSPKGIQAARAAGIKCLAVSNSYPSNMLSHADWIVSSVSEFNF